MFILFIKISLKFVARDPINDIPSLVQIVVCLAPVRHKPLSESMMALFTDVYTLHSASMIKEKII